MRPDDFGNMNSDFALLDVKGRGRHFMREHFDRLRPNIGECPTQYRVPVTIVGYLDGIASDDDGISTEFTVVVERMELGMPEKSFDD